MAHDLSFNKVEIDLRELIKVSAEACKNARFAMDHYYKRVQNEIMYPHVKSNNEEIYRINHSIQFNAQIMAEYAQEYADALNAYFVLVECLHRDEVVINMENVK